MYFPAVGGGFLHGFPILVVIAPSMSMIAVDHMGWDEVVHHARDELDTPDTTNETAYDSVCRCFWRQTTIHEIIFGGGEHTV